MNQEFTEKEINNGVVQDILNYSIEEQIGALRLLTYSINRSQEIVDIIELLKPIVEGNYERRVIITGVGKNANLATKASETFCSLGIPSMYLNSCHYAHGDAGFIGPNDVVIHVSRSGKTAELIYAAKHLKTIRPNVKQIMLHCNPKLKESVLDLDDFIDINFCTGEVKEADEHGLAPTTSTTVLLVTLDAIGIYLSSHIKFSRRDFLSYHPGGSLGQMLKAEE